MFAHTHTDMKRLTGTGLHRQRSYCCLNSPIKYQKSVVGRRDGDLLFQGAEFQFRKVKNLGNG